MNGECDGLYPELSKKLLESIEELLAANSQVNRAIVEHELRGLCSKVRSSRTGYPLLLKAKPSQEINRLGSVLLGPVFTSEAHPWPVDKDVNPMAPLCQIATDHLPRKLQGVEGLVQVWMMQSKSTNGEVLIRVIPAADVVEKLMTPVISHDGDVDVLLPDAVEWLREFHSEVKPSKSQYISANAEKLGYSTSDELADSNWHEWVRLAEEYGDKYGEDVVVCWQVTGFDEVRLYCDITIDQRGAIATLVKLKKKLDKKSSEADLHLIPFLAEVCDAYEAWENACGETVYPCLFGTFQEIQYSATDNDDPFICLEAIGLRDWGDGGNAQVFYSNERGFRFDWSCF